ncbi:MAG: hypothetical protein IH627_00925 [Rubrivivax sp.]|nr:hypothetical protein [Rubrivivax sp.]
MAASATPLSVLIVTDPFAETSDDAIAIAGALADVGHLVLGSPETPARGGNDA